MFSTQGPVQVSVYQYVRILPVQGTVGPYGSNAIVKSIAAVRKIDFRFFYVKRAATKVERELEEIGERLSTKVPTQ